MDITDKDGLWKVTETTITNRITNEVRIVKNIPQASTIAFMDYTTFLRRCEIGFNTGSWPVKHWKDKD
jgi:hypothetical protein